MNNTRVAAIALTPLTIHLHMQVELCMHSEVMIIKPSFLHLQLPRMVSVNALRCDL